ncbi:MAG: hypothetical protein K2W88_15725 [Pararheinheimera sp.]|nr:hypothetical protein [Rheinheimera sp.]
MFAVLLSVLFLYQQQMLSALMLSLLVLRMCFTFGALIPTGVGTLLV